ncbi:MAG: hypothetical protein MRJ68_20320 [Nitrospira sp.]|nr:hypothetical protein [Nitrospira sp.]
MPQRFPNSMMRRRWTIIALVMVCLGLAGCYERLVEPAAVFGDITRGATYSPASTMIDDWYAVEAIDPQTVAINEPHSSQYNTSYLIVGETRAVMFDAGRPARMTRCLSHVRPSTVWSSC